MVAGFRRTLSLPGSQPNSPRPKAAQEKSSFHVRSASLPCRSHPIISQLEDEIRVLRAWLQSQPEPGHESGSPGAWLSAGLAQLELLHSILDDLLNLPQTQESLQKAGGWTERVLEDFLHFADAHGTFRSTIIALKQDQSAAQIAARRKDALGLQSCVRSQKRTEKELAKLASSLRAGVAKSMATPAGFEEAELVGIMREVAVVTVSVSASVFLGTAALSSSTSAAAASSLLAPSWMVGTLKRLSSSPSLKKRSTEEEEEEIESRRISCLERLEGLEECIAALESRNDRLFRCLVNTRVSLLNILTP